MMLDLYKLHIFTVVYERGSISAAAEHLLMTQSAVSQHIQQLELIYGTRLFERNRRGVTPTQSGVLLNDYANKIFQLVAEAANAITDVTQLESGHLNIGATPGVSVYLLPDKIQAFRTQFPRLTISLQTAITSQIIDDIHSQRTDLGLIEGELAESARAKLEIIELQEVAQWVVVGQKHAWWGRESVSLAELQGQQFIMRQPHSQTRIWLDKTLRQHGITPKIMGEFDNVESIKRAVMSGKCLTILPMYAVEQERQLQQMSVIAIKENPFKRVLKLIWRRDKLPSPIAKRFIDYLLAQG